MLAQGLIIDNDTGEIVVPGEVYPPSEYPDVWRCNNNGPTVFGVDPVATAYACGESDYAARHPDCRQQPLTFQNPRWNGANQYLINACSACGCATLGSNRQVNTGQADIDPLPASDSQVVESISDNTLRDLINDLIQRRPSGIPTVLPELASEMDATRDAQEAAESHSADPETNPAPTPEQQEIVDNQTTTEPTFAQEFPGFCSWATVVCDFIDWMRAEPELPEHPPIPLLDIDIPDYDSNLPSTVQCPAPVVVTTQMWGSFELSYQPFCDLADYIRYGVLGIAYLFAAYTIIGVRR